MTTRLNPKTEKYIADKVSSGLYASSRDVIEAGIHLLQKYEDTVVPSTSTEEKQPVSDLSPVTERRTQARNVSTAEGRRLRKLEKKTPEKPITDIHVLTAVMPSRRTVTRPAEHATVKKETRLPRNFKSGKISIPTKFRGVSRSCLVAI